MRTGLQSVVIAQDRLRVDCVDLLLHDLRSYAIGGLVIHTSSVNARGIVQFRIRHDTFFIDPRLSVHRVGTQQMIDEAELDQVAGILRTLPMPEAWSKTWTGEPQPDWVRILRRSRRGR